MTPKFRTLALAVMSWGAALSAQAEPIGFEELATQALNDTDSGKYPNGRPLDLVPGSLQVPGFSFSGATVYHVKQTIAGLPGPKDPAHKGFIQSRNADGTTINQTISVTLAGSNAGGNIDALSFSLAARQWAVDLKVWDTAGNSKNLSALSFTNPDFAWTVRPSLNFNDLVSQLGTVNRIDFISRFVSGEGYSQFALDDLAFTLSGIGGGTVPEPAGLGLVALALAAAGLTSRKRRA